MFKLNCLLLCFASLAVSSFASMVPFIDPCEEQDTACLIKSSQKAIPYFADGGFLGLPPLDPLRVDKTVSSNEGGLNIEFKDITIAGTKNCLVTGVEVNTKSKYLKFSSNCPIHAKGTYATSGSMLGLAVEGNGPFTVDADEVHLAIKVLLNIVIGADGQEHWEVSKPEYTFELQKNSNIKLENLFNGDEEKAAPVYKILAQNSKGVIELLGKPIVDEVINGILEHFETVTAAVPRSDIQKI